MNEDPTRRRLVGAVAACLVAAVALAFGLALLRGPAFVDRVSVVNRSPYDIHVEVRGADGGEWTSVTTADRGSTSVGLDIIDQGAVWLFRFRAQGRDGGELRLTRTELQQAGWALEVPDTVVVRLRDSGAPPTP